MKKPPTIHGLLCTAAAKRLQAEREEVTHRSRTAGPHSAYVAGEEAKRLVRDALELSAMADENADVINVIEAAGKALALLGTTEARSLARWALNEAADRLRREIGDAPQVASAE